MFLAQAHSFAQQARLAITLSFVAGYTNILAVLTCGHVVSHMTGAVAELGQQSAAGRFWLAGFAVLLLMAFFLGAALAGILTEIGRIRGWRSIYVWPMSIQGLLLSLFALLVEVHDARQIETGAMRLVMTTLAAAAMGLQNATITRISGGVVRTTHVTGVLTDLGLESALLVLRRSRNDPQVGMTAAWATPKRLFLLATIIAAFAGGTFLATVAYSVIPRLSMLPPVILLLWIIYQDLVRPIAEMSPVRAIGGLSIEDLGGGVLAYHVLPGSKPARGYSKGNWRPVLPDLLRWADDLPEAARVLLLDLSQFPYLSASGADEIRALASRLNALGVRLVLGGLDHHMYELLRQRGALDLIGHDNVSGDTELALARAVSISNKASLVR